MSDTGRRTSARTKNPICRLGDPVDPTALRKKATKKAPADKMDGNNSNHTTTSARSAIRRKEIEVNLQEEISKIGETHSKLSQQLQELELTIELSTKKLKLHEINLETIKTQDSNDEALKQETNIIKGIKEELDQYNSCHASLSLKCRLEAEDLARKKKLLELRADLEKDKVDLEEEELSSEAESLVGLGQFNKANVTAIWANGARDQLGENPIASEKDGLNHNPPPQEHSIDYQLTLATRERNLLQTQATSLGRKIQLYTKEIAELKTKENSGNKILEREMAIVSYSTDLKALKEKLEKQQEIVQDLNEVVQEEANKQKERNKRLCNYAQKSWDQQYKWVDTEPATYRDDEVEEDKESIGELQKRFKALKGEEEKEPPESEYDAMAKAFANAMSNVFPKAREPTNNTSEKFLARQLLGRDLPTFSGKPEEWIAFIHAFEVSTKSGEFSNQENLIRLQRCLKGEALKTVQCLLVDAKGVTEAVKKLKLRFGRPGSIINAMITKVKETPAVKNDKCETLVNFGLEVDNLVVTMKSLGAPDQLPNPSLVYELVQKLPTHLQLDWSKYKRKKSLEFPTLEDFANWIRPLTEAAFDLCPIASGTDYKEKKSFEKHYHEKKTRKHQTERTFVASDRSGQRESRPARKDRPCTFCQGKHRNSNCPEFEKATIEKRYELLKEKKGCFGCLNPDHRIIECRSKKTCGIDGCRKTHHAMLHYKGKEDESTQVKEASHTTHQSEEKNESSSSAELEVGFCATQGKDINYNVVPVYAKRKDGSLIPAFLALDIYSSLTSASNFTKEDLGIQGEKRPLTVKGFQATTTTNESYVLDIEIVSKLDGFSTILKGVKTVPTLDLPRQSVSSEMVKQYSHLRGVPLETYNNVMPTILVGMDNYQLHLHREIREGQPGEPVAIRTDMGWAVVGPTSQLSMKVHHTYHAHEETDDTLHHLVKQFFTTEYVGVKPNLEKLRTKEDARAQSIMDRTVRRTQDGWETGLLWKEDKVKLPNSKWYAQQRLRSMEKKMDRNPEFARQYVERIQEYKDKGFARPLTQAEAEVETDKTFYLPHFMAYNEKKPKKFRFVFDAAAKVGGQSLNDHLLQGPDKLVSLPGALLKFRQRKIALVADIKDMFHRIKVSKEDVSAQRFLWRGMERNKEPEVWEMGVLIFGASCSPACAQEAKNKNAEENKEQFPKAHDAIVFRHYMDDLLDCCDTSEEAIQLRMEVTEVHRRGSFQICNWISNDSRVMDSIPAELKSKSMNTAFNSEDNIERVLGLFWNHNQDQFTFCRKYLKAKEEVLNSERIPTKREVLSLVMSVFDPLGYLATLTVKAKMILQQTWRTEIGWDDEIPASTHAAWKIWLQQLEQIETFHIPRCYSPYFSSADELQLHIFCDASEEAFGAVAFFRMTKNEEVEIALVMAKSNVAPIKHLTVPRLELQAALMGARLAKFVHEQHEIRIDRTIFWSDSATVLGWIRADGKRFQQFVATRIGEIQELTSATQWKWIPTSENVADELTRMNSVCDWDQQSRWVNGSPFLRQHEDTWPQENRKKAVPAEAWMELKKDQILQATTVETVLNAADFSNWKHLIRVTAYILRFIRKAQKKSEQRGELSPHELKSAEKWWTGRMQQDSFGLEMKALSEGAIISKQSRLFGLNPSLDISGDKLLRVGGRLHNSDLPLPTKQPIIMDPKHPYTKLVIQHYHEMCQHQGQERIANELRQNFFIMGLRTAVRSAQSRCQHCKNERAKPTPPQMGQLPRMRVEDHGVPFKNTGLDYFGPIEVIVKRGREKRYVALFTCLATRAVHLELAGYLSTDSCIMALRRFFARRGCPSSIHSDNGTNFVGANSELQQALSELDQVKIEGLCSNKGVEWNFIPPLSPNFGGSWERLVRSVKTALGDALTKKNLHEEVLNTVLAEAEHTVNSHPLTHVPVDPNDPEALTPNHFLIHRSSNLQPMGNFGDHDLFGRRQWRVVQVLAEHFWKRWVKEYLPTLLRRQKWFAATKPIQVGDIVLEANENYPRNCWPMGRVVKLYPGKDEIVRVVDIVLANGRLFKRPVSKLCVLDVHQEENKTATS